VSVAPLLAFAAGALGVLAAWEALAAVDQGAPVRAVERWLAPLRAGREPTPVERRRLALVGAATLAAGGWLVAGPVAAVALSAAGPLAVRQVLALRRRRLRDELAAGAPASARALADALAGGHSVRGAIDAAARTGGVPGEAGRALRRAAAELALGEPTAGVLTGLRRQAGDRAWDALVAAILLQSDAGGDLATLLRDLAVRLEEARRAEGEARAATAQARFTAGLVAALPAGAAVLAELAAPGFLAGLLRSPLSGSLVAASVLLQLAAFVAIRRIGRPA
jgi:tight adherence protein B